VPSLAIECNLSLCAVQVLVQSLPIIVLGSLTPFSAPCNNFAHIYQSPDKAGPGFKAFFIGV
jgi:hypothetical protein